MNKNFFLIIFFASITHGSNLGNPAVSIPGPRLAIGASYHLGGYTITDLEIPSMFNRFHARLEFAPASIFSLGIDVGATQVEVDKYITGGDTFPAFHGKYGFSGGAHLKLSTPFFLKKAISITTIGQVSMFSSQNKNTAMYGGYDGAGAAGVQIHIPKFGYITAGPMVYLIRGKNRSFDGKESTFSNINNIRGWMVIDFFPDLKEMSSNKPFISLEVTASPDATYSRKIPVQEFSVSLCIGSVSRRLYGVESDVEWKP